MIIDLSLALVYALAILIGICLFTLVGIVGLVIIQISHANKEKSKRYLENINYGIVGGIIAVILLEMRGNSWMHLNFYIIELPLALLTIFIFILVGFGYLYAIDKLFKTLEDLENGKYSRKPFKLGRALKFMGKKEWFAVKIILITLASLYLSWIVADKFSSVFEKNQIGLIIQTAIFLAGFGLLAIGREEKAIPNSLVSVILPNLKSIILWSMTSIIFAFLYLSFPNTPWEINFIKLSIGFLFFTFVLILLLVLFHDNEHLQELETKEN